MTKFEFDDVDTTLGPIGNTWRVVIAPGNSTRYDLVISRLKERVLMVTWLHQGGSGGSSILTSLDTYTDPFYVAAKMDLPYQGDAEAIAAFIGAIKDRYNVNT